MAASNLPPRSDLTGTRPAHPAEFQFPKSHSFPPLYTLQPNPTTRNAQLQKWSRSIQQYCRFHRIFLLSFPACLELPLFRNKEIAKVLTEKDARTVLTWIASVEGGMRGEWRGFDGYWVYWKRPEEWGESIWRWVDEVGQKGAVLTFYELLHGEATAGQDFHEMDQEVFTKALTSLVKTGKAQVFGDEDSRGVKFF